MRKARYDIAPYADVEIPTYREYHPPEPTQDTSGWSGIVVTANVLLAAVLIVGMLWDGRSVVVSIITGGLYYAATTLGVIALSSGQAAAMWRTWQTERTARYHIDAWEYLAERKLELEQPARALPADPPQTPPAALPGGDTYVPAYTTQDIAEALAYAEGLYDRDGYLSRRHVHANGKIRTGVIGSQSQGGSQNARQYLIDRRFLVYREGGYWVAKHLYPTKRELSRLYVGAGT